MMKFEVRLIDLLIQAIMVINIIAGLIAIILVSKTFLIFIISSIGFSNQSWSQFSLDFWLVEQRFIIFVIIFSRVSSSYLTCAIVSNTVLITFIIYVIHYLLSITLVEGGLREWVFLVDLLKNFSFNKSAFKLSTEVYKCGSQSCQLSLFIDQTSWSLLLWLLAHLVVEFVDHLAVALSHSFLKTCGSLDYVELLLGAINTSARLTLFTLFALDWDKFLLVTQVGETLQSVHFADESAIFLLSVPRVQLFIFYHLSLV